MALSALILYLYFLILAAYSFSIGSMVVDIRVGIKVVVSLKKSGGNKVIRVLRLRSRSRVIYTFSTALGPVGLVLARL